MLLVRREKVNKLKHNEQANVKPLALTVYYMEKYSNGYITKDPWVFVEKIHQTVIFPYIHYIVEDHYEKTDHIPFLYASYRM